MTADQLIQQLGLIKHPEEGGFFRETYRSAASIVQPGYAGNRSLGTAIYYLIAPTSISMMHVLPGDEIFHHYVGDAVEMLLLHSDKRTEIVRLGKDIAKGERPQVVVPGGVWQGAKLAAGGAFALLGTTMSPGFDYADYKHGRRDELIAQFPAEAVRIRLLTP